MYIRVGTFSSDQLNFLNELFGEMAEKEVKKSEEESAKVKILRTEIKNLDRVRQEQADEIRELRETVADDEVMLEEQAKEIERLNKNIDALRKVTEQMTESEKDKRIRVLEAKVQGYEDFLRRWQKEFGGAVV